MEKEEQVTQTEKESSTYTEATTLRNLLWANTRTRGINNLQSGMQEHPTEANAAKMGTAAAHKEASLNAAEKKMAQAEEALASCETCSESRCIGRRMRLHPSTRLVLVMVAGVLIGLNVRPKVDRSGGVTYGIPAECWAD